ncbi:hypothetical protein HWV62_31469 [Athelia sp. TMB]|nr:hypothetical protein HWV62_31469 [Athelia sp. TMB]
MDKTKSKLAAFFDQDDEDTPLPQKAVNEQKRSTYAQGSLRKSKREKEKEAADAKAREEEEDAARAYAEFIDTFEGQDGGTKRDGSNFVKAGVAPSKSSSAEISRKPRAFNQVPSPPSTGPPKPKGKRAMDAFLEEIKRDQASRESRYSNNSYGKSVSSLAAYEGQSGSKDRGDPETTNIFTKVMWPRQDLNAGADPRRAKPITLTGFVSFMKRKDAETALDEFNGYDWGGSILKRLVKTDRMTVPETAAMGMGGAELAARRHIGGDLDLDLAVLTVIMDLVAAVHVPDSPLREDEVEVVTDMFIRTVAAEVRGHDAKYEATLKERERNNPKYGFLLNKHHRRHAFYRGLVEREDGIDPAFDDEGYNSVYSTDSAEDSERENGRKTVLGKLARKRFEAMLRALSGKRGELARCMAFSLEHAEAAPEVSEIIVASLLVDGTAVPRKVARLHLICDILHNSAAPVPSAWKFRQEFQSRLGIVFDHLATIYHSFPGRITAETFKKQITAVVDIWDDWIVFPPDFTAELRARLDGASLLDETPQVNETPAGAVQENTQVMLSKFKASSFQPASLVTEAHPIITTGTSSGEAMVEDLDGEPVEDDVDGEPLDDDVDGEPLDNVDGKPMGNDVDGEPMDDEDLDGEPMEEDVDGVPLDA